MYLHRRRSGWNSGATHGERRRWIGAEWDEVWEGCPPQPTMGLGASWSSSPAGSAGQSPGRKRFLVYFEGRRTLLFVLIWQNLGEGTICISVSPLQILGDLSPVSPWSTPMCIYICMHVSWRRCWWKQHWVRVYSWRLLRPAVARRRWLCCLHNLSLQQRATPHRSPVLARQAHVLCMPDTLHCTYCTLLPKSRFRFRFSKV